MILNMMSFHRKLITKAAQVGLRNLRTSSALNKNLYEALGLTRDATQADIKNAYFELSKIYHPDRIAATDENLARFREITDAYEVLGNEHSRRLYDRGLVGDFKRPGMDDTPEVIDPIVKFYKRRHEMAKPKPSEEVDTFTEKYYMEVKSKAAAKAQFYTVPKKHKLERDNPFEDFFLLGVLLGLGFLWLTNFKNTKPQRAWDAMMNYFSSD